MPTSDAVNSALEEYANVGTEMAEAVTTLNMNTNKIIKNTKTGRVYLMLDIGTQITYIANSYTNIPNLTIPEQFKPARSTFINGLVFGANNVVVPAVFGVSNVTGIIAMVTTIANPVRIIIQGEYLTI